MISSLLLPPSYLKKRRRRFFRAASSTLRYRPDLSWYTKEYRSRRERRERFGELVQFDGSHHKRFEDRGPSCCLMTMIDDAANTRMSRFFE